MRSFFRNAGFSIIELMIVVAIIGVLAAIAIPSFNDMIKNNRRTVVINELMSNLMLARTEAAKRGHPVSICANTSTGGISCTGGTNWDYGWMVFLDSDGNGAIAATTDVLRQFVNNYSDIKIKPNGLFASPAVGVIAMKPFNEKSTSGTITICDNRGASKARALVLSPNGRALISDSGLSCS